MVAKSTIADTSPELEFAFTRLIDAPRELVFAAFKDPHHISQWWGPNRFTTTTYEMDVRVGGQWLFTMHGPDAPTTKTVSDIPKSKRRKLLAYDHDGGDGADQHAQF